jgi:hypothetical protein
MRKTLAEKARLVPAIVLAGILVFSSLSSLLPNQRWTVGSTISTARADSMQTALIDENLTRAVNYLYRNYNDTIGLINESPDDSNLTLHNTYWIYSDNYLASLVLWNYDPSNTNWTGMAVNITNKMKNYTGLAGIANPVNQYMVLTENVSEFAFNNSDPFTLNTTDDGATVKTTQNNRSTRLDKWNYADIGFLYVAYYCRLNLTTDAMNVYRYWDNLYDSEGKGFKDDAFNDTHTYATYKLALYIYASKLLGQVYNPQANTTLRAMQQDNGGFATYYDSNLQAVSSTNTETTSLAVLSLIPVPPEPVPTEPIPEFGMMPFVVMVFLAAVVLTIGARRRKVQ